MTTMSEPADLALVLRSYSDRPDEVLIRDDTAAKEWDGAADNGERWFGLGDFESDPLCWDVVTRNATCEGATLAELAPKSVPLTPHVVAEDEIAALSAAEPDSVPVPPVREVLDMVERYAAYYVDAGYDNEAARYEIEQALWVLREHAPKRRPLPAAEQPVGAIVATDEEVFRKGDVAGDEPWESRNFRVSNAFIDDLLTRRDAALLRGEGCR